MPNLKNYILNNFTDKGDYNVTMTFDDNSSSTQTIHFGILTDDQESSAAEKLNDVVTQYAQDYQQGLDIQVSQPQPGDSLSSIQGKSQNASGGGA